MDKEIMDMITEERLEPVNISVVNVDVDMEDEESSAETAEAVTVEVEPVEEIEIEVDEAIGWAGGDNERHYSLLGRDDPDQHTIGAITGLREELDEIERIKTVYSDKFNVANYYEWDNVTYSDYGCFVCIVPNTSKIKICDGLDILGVSVSDAGFVGGQVQAAPRDNSYGLIVTSGLVDVRCETDVEVGDYVVSNIRGWAKKSESNYGYRVLAKENKDGNEHVVILLGVQADKTNAIGEEINDLTKRVETNERNIVSAINVANQAYNKALSSEDSAAASKSDIEEILRELLGFGETIDEMEKSVVASSLISARAKEIADSAVASAISMRDEAVKNANKALADTVELREELKNTTTKMNADLNNAVLDLKDLKEDLTPLATWPEGSDINNSIGYAGFVARVDENSSILGTMVGRKGEDGETLAGFIQEAEETRATVRGIVSYEYKDKNGNPVTGAAGLMAQVDDTKSEVSAVANRSFTKEDGTVVTGLAGLNAQVDENESNVSLVANRVAGKYTVIPEVVAEDKRDPSKIYSSYDKNSNTTTYYYKNSSWATTTTWSDLSLNTSIVYYVAANKLYWYYKNNAWTFTTDAHTAGLPASIAGIQVVADDNSSSINSLTSWQGTTKTAIARIEQKADANGAYIQSTVANIDRYSVGPHSQAYLFTLEQAQSVLEEGMIYVPTNSVTEDYEYKDGKETKKASRSFTPGYLYQWDDIDWAGDGTGWKTVGESPSVAFSTETPTANGIIQYWYTDGEPSDDTYEPYTLYKWSEYITKNENGEDISKSAWTPVATLAGNSQSRAVSQIRQDANSIETSVTGLRGEYAGTKQTVEEDHAKVKSIASWPTGEGTHNMAIFEQKADANNPHMVLAVVRDVDGKPKVEELGGARIVMSDDATLGSYIQFDADLVNFGDNVTITNTGNDVMNVADKFIVSRDGSVRLDGNITWGTDSSPTQVVYCSAYITKPANNTVWSSFPETSTTGWHKKFASGSDYYGSYTYDGGATWGEPVQIVGVNGQNGQNGKDANVTDVNVFNALTNNGTKFGCFTNVEGKLYINAQYIKSGTIESELTMTGKVVAKNIEASGGKIGAWNLGTAPMGSAYSGSLYTTSSDGNYGYVTFLRGISSPTNIVFGIKRSAVIDDGWNAEDANEDVFYIRGSGALYAKSIELGSGTIGSDSSVLLSTTNKAGTLASTYAADWRMTVGSSFGVTSTGHLLAKGAELTDVTFKMSGFDTKISGTGISFNTSTGSIFGNIWADLTGQRMYITAPSVVVGISGSTGNYLYGTWNIQQSLTSTSSIVTSDENKKNNIDFLDSRYNVFF